MALKKSGAYQPRCAVTSDDAFATEVALPRRLARRNRFVRGGIAVGAAATVGVLAVMTPGIAQSVSAANVPAPEAETTEVESTIRVGTTDAFSSRGTSTDRDTTRPELDVTAAALQRTASVVAVDQKVAESQAAVAAQARTEALATTGSAIDAEAERIASQIFFWPTEGGIASPWGMRLHPILGYTRLHGGADIGGAIGAPIYAVADGVVTKAAHGYNGGSGNNVALDHGQLGGEHMATTYLHMTDIDVAVGQKVKKGQRIGTVGSTGLSTSPHLHFSVFVNGVNSDPAIYLNAGR